MTHRTASAPALIVATLLLLVGASARGAGRARKYTYDERGNLSRVTNVDTAYDPTNCGAVGNVCFSTSNGFATCTGGACGVHCNGGFYMCSGMCVTADAARVTGCSGPTDEAAWLVPILDLVLEAD